MTKSTSKSGSTINEIKIGLIGNRGVGKTSLIERFITGAQINLNKKAPTLGHDLYQTNSWINMEHYKIKFFDHGGQKKYYDLTKNFYNQQDAFVLVFNMGDEETFESALRWLHQVRELKEECPLILVGNQIDNEEDIVVKEEEVLEVQSELGVACILTSALSGQNVDEAFTYVIQLAYNKL